MKTIALSALLLLCSLGHAIEPRNLGSMTKDKFVWELPLTWLDAGEIGAWLNGAFPGKFLWESQDNTLTAKGTSAELNQLLKVLNLIDLKFNTDDRNPVQMRIYELKALDFATLHRKLKREKLAAVDLLDLSLMSKQEKPKLFVVGRSKAVANLLDHIKDLDKK